MYTCIHTFYVCTYVHIYIYEYVYIYIYIHTYICNVSKYLYIHFIYLYITLYYYYIYIPHITDFNEVNSQWTCHRIRDAPPSQNSYWQDTINWNLSVISGVPNFGGIPSGLLRALQMCAKRHSDSRIPRKILRLFPSFRCLSISAQDHFLRIQHCFIDAGTHLEW